MTLADVMRKCPFNVMLLRGAQCSDPGDQVRGVSDVNERRMASSPGGSSSGRSSIQIHCATDTGLPIANRPACDGNSSPAPTRTWVQYTARSK
jgi:hypothetical protein